MHPASATQHRWRSAQRLGPRFRAPARTPVHGQSALRGLFLYFAAIPGRPMVPTTAFPPEGRDGGQCLRAGCCGMGGMTLFTNRLVENFSGGRSARGEATGRQPDPDTPPMGGRSRRGRAFRPWARRDRTPRPDRPTMPSWRTGKFAWRRRAPKARQSRSGAPTQILLFPPLETRSLLSIFEYRNALRVHQVVDPAWKADRRWCAAANRRPRFHPRHRRWNAPDRTPAGQSRHA